jgi:hypothetical protein
VEGIGPPHPACFWITALLLMSGVVRAVPPTPPPLRDVTGSTLPPVTWTHTFNFDDGLQGWTIDPGSNPPMPGQWVDPALMPEGMPLPDGQPSGSSGILGDAAGGTGGGSIYLPGDNAGGSGSSPEAIAERTIESLIGVPSSNSLVMQVDVYVPNLLPITGFRHGGAYPGNHLESAGFCMVNPTDAMCLEGASSTASGIPNPNWNAYLRFRDFSGSAGNEWQFPTCCPNVRIQSLEGIWPSGNCSSNGPNGDKTDWWDQWITLYVNYNYSKANEVYVWAYIPWSHPHPTCTIGYTSGWVEIVRRTIDAGYTPTPWTKLQLSGQFSWTQAQWDNVKLCLMPPCHTPPFDVDRDTDVDLDDFGAFQRCYTGQAAPPGAYLPAECRCFDRYPAGAPDNSIDHNDFAAFAACTSRAGVPAPTDCN